MGLLRAVTLFRDFSPIIAGSIIMNQSLLLSGCSVPTTVRRREERREQELRPVPVLHWHELTNPHSDLRGRHYYPPFQIRKLSLREIN